MPGPLVHLGKQGRRRNRLCPLTDDLSPDNHSRREQQKQEGRRRGGETTFLLLQKKRTAGVQQLDIVDIVQFDLWSYEYFVHKYKSSKLTVTRHLHSTDLYRRLTKPSLAICVFSLLWPNTGQVDGDGRYHCYLSIKASMRPFHGQSHCCAQYHYCELIIWN